MGVLVQEGKLSCKGPAQSLPCVMQGNPICLRCVMWSCDIDNPSCKTRSYRCAGPRSCWKGLTLRTANTSNCGALVFGPSCLSLTCRSCEFGGHNGLCLPPDEVLPVQLCFSLSNDGLKPCLTLTLIHLRPQKLSRSLILEDCHVHDIRGAAALIAYSGHLKLHGRL